MPRKKATKDTPAPQSDLVPKSGTGLPAGYGELLEDLKARVRSSQLKAAVAVNREMIRLYWDIGRLIVERQERDGWGKGVVDRLAKDIQKAFPGLKGFSPGNVWRMRAFYLAYTKEVTILAQPARELDGQNLPQAATELPWFHNVILIEKLKEPLQRLWYARQAVQHGWSRTILEVQIESNLYGRQGKAVTNFAATLPPPQSDLARETLKDPYLFDVRHDNRERIADAVSKTLGRRCLSRPTYLKSKDDRKHSLLVKRRLTTKCPDHAPQGLRSMVKATLLELQFHRTLGSPVGRAFDDDAGRSGRLNQARPDPQRPG